MKTHVQFICVGKRLTVLLDEEYDLTQGCGLPIKGDIVFLPTKPGHKQFWVIERHWNFGNVVGMVIIYVAPTSEQARTI